jgi:hypothetical protein
MDGQRHEARNPQLSATAEALAEVFEIPSVCVLQSLSLAKIIGPKIRSCAKNVNCQTSEQTAQTFGDTNFGETINGLIVFVQ